MRTRYLLHTHIIIRYEIERDLFDGKIGVDDLPMIWSQKYREYFGSNITDDKDGILQDVHWANGYFGYFPAYAMGSMNAAQLEEAVKKTTQTLIDGMLWATSHSCYLDA